MEQSSITYANANNPTRTEKLAIPQDIVNDVQIWNGTIFLSIKHKLYSLSLSGDNEVKVLDEPICQSLNEKFDLLLSPIDLLFISHKVTRDVVDECLSYSSLFPMNMVQQVACGKEHTLCLTRTGELFSWGRGCAALGLGPEYCHPNVLVDQPRRVDKCCISFIDSVVVQIATGDYHSVAVIAKLKPNQVEPKTATTTLTTVMTGRSNHPRDQNVVYSIYSQHIYDDWDNISENSLDVDSLALTFPGENSLPVHEMSYPSFRGSPSSFHPQPVDKSQSTNENIVLSEMPSTPSQRTVRIHRATPESFQITSQPIFNSNVAPSQPTKKDQKDDVPMSYPDPWDKLLLRSVLVWGSNTHGQLGIGDRGDRYWPTLLQQISYPVASFGCPFRVACGANHSVLLTTDSQVFAWGDNTNQQIVSNAEDGECDNFYVNPIQMVIPNFHQVWDVCAMSIHTVLLTYVLDKPTILKFGGNSPFQTLPYFNEKEVPYLLTGHEDHFVCSVISEPNTIQQVLRTFCCNERTMVPQLGRVVFSLVRNVFHSDMQECLGHTHPGSTFIVVLDLFQKIYYRMISNIFCATRCLQYRETAAQFCHAFIHSYLPILAMYSSWLSKFILQNGFQLVCDVHKIFFNSLEVDLKGMQSDPERSLNEILLAPFKHAKSYEELFNVSPNESSESDNYFLTVYKEVTALITGHEDLMLKSERSVKVLKKIKNQELVQELKRRRCLILFSSDECPLSLQKSGKVNGKQIFILCEDCFIFVLSDGEWTTHNLKLIWLRHRLDLNNGFDIQTPEESITLYSNNESNKLAWTREISMALCKACYQHDPSIMEECKKSSFHWDDLWIRTGNYTFKKKPFEKFVYEGQWLRGKMDGRGVLKWPNGTIYDGEFRSNEPDGHGKKTILLEGDMEQVIIGQWKQGKMHGYAELKTKPFGEIYRGTFYMDKRQGHGMQQIVVAGQKTESIYIGEWLDGRKHGYGVEEIISRSEKYFGEWCKDQRTGQGTLVTVPSNYYEGRFERGKLNGDGIIDTGDGNVYEGEIADSQMKGKGILFLRSGDQLVGTFSGTSENGSIKFSGSVIPTVRLDDKTARYPRIGHYAICDAFPRERCWYQLTEHLFGQLLGYQDCTSCAARIVTSKDNDGVNLIPDNRSSLIPFPTLVRSNYTLEETKRAWDRLCSILARRNIANAWRKDNPLPESLSRVPSLPTSLNGEFKPCHLNAIRDYLREAFKHPRHPLHQYIVSFRDAFENTFAGLGVHDRMLPQALAQVKLMHHRLYALVRLLFPCLPPEDMNAMVCNSLKNWEEKLRMVDELERADSECFYFTSRGLINIYLLPQLHSSLFTLFALKYQSFDNAYSSELRRVSKLPDYLLMVHFDVSSRSYCFERNSANDMNALPTTWKSPYNALAIELSQLNSLDTPREKILLMDEILSKLTKMLSTYYNSGQVSADDILPLIVFICARARVPNLGAELAYIGHLCEVSLDHGKPAVAFRNFQAAYCIITGRKPDEVFIFDDV